MRTSLPTGAMLVPVRGRKYPIDTLARIAATGFEDVRRGLGVDDMALNKTSRDEHRVLAARVSDIEEGLI